MTRPWPKRWPRSKAPARPWFWSPTGPGFPFEYQSISNELRINLFADGELVVGAATLDALITAYVNSQATSNRMHDLVLFGDPATRLAMNRDSDTVLDRNRQLPQRGQ